jgi:hypothetical protein
MGNHQDQEKIKLQNQETHEATPFVDADEYRYKMKLLKKYKIGGGAREDHAIMKGASSKGALESGQREGNCKTQRELRTLGEQKAMLMNIK